MTLRHKLAVGTLVTALAIVHVALALSAAHQHSATFDEPAHIASGYSYWTMNDYRLMPDGGILPKRIATLPLALSNPDRINADAGSWRAASPFAVGLELLYSGRDTAASILSQSRSATAIFGFGIVWLVFGWARSLGGNAAGLVAATLAAFSPTLLAHSPLVTSDAAAALFFALASWCLWRLLQAVTLQRLAASILATTALALSKFSAPLLLVVAAPMVAVRLLTRAPLPVALLAQRSAESLRSRMTVILLLVGVHLIAISGFIWAAYGFQYHALADPSQPALEQSGYWTMGNGDSAGHQLIDVLKSNRILPEAYLQGLAFTLVSTSARMGFMDGEYGIHGWWQFFPYALLIKTPPALFALLLMAIAVLIRMPAEQRRQLLYDLTPVLSLFVVYLGVAMTSSINIGQRHILPLYPLLFVVAGLATGFAANFATAASPRLLNAFLPLLLIAFMFSSTSVRPHYLGYFNEIAGGPENGWRRLVDSSLDWGQELPAIKNWLDQNQQPDEPAYLAWFGSAPPQAHGIRARPLPSFFDHNPRHVPPPLEGGLYLISATMLQTVYGDCTGPWSAGYESEYQQLQPLIDLNQPTETYTESDWAAMQRFETLRFCRLAAVLRQHEPPAQIGYSIMAYRLSKAFIDSALAIDTNPPRPAP